MLNVFIFEKEIYQKKWEYSNSAKSFIFLKCIKKNPQRKKLPKKFLPAIKPNVMINFYLKYFLKNNIIYTCLLHYRCSKIWEIRLTYEVKLLRKEDFKNFQDILISISTKFVSVIILKFI